jgi:hypothetical protein
MEKKRDNVNQLRAIYYDYINNFLNIESCANVYGYSKKTLEHLFDRIKVYYKVNGTQITIFKRISPTSIQVIERINVSPIELIDVFSIVNEKYPYYIPTRINQ